MFVLKTAFFNLFSFHHRSILPVILPWFSSNSIRIPDKRLTLVAQLDKLASFGGRTLDAQKLSGMQAAAETSVNAAALLFDSLIEEINATGTVTPKLAALCELAPITAQALPIGTPFELATPPLKQAA